MTMRSPWSAWTSLVYAVTGGGVLYLDWLDPAAFVVGLSMIGLGAASFWMHATEGWGTPETADHVFMHSTLASIGALLLTGSAGWTLVAAVAAPVGMELWQDAEIEAATGVYVLFIAVGALRADWLLAVAGLGLLALSLVAHRRHTDFWHGMGWHLGNGAGLLLLYMAGR